MASSVHMEWLDVGVLLVRVEGAMTVNDFTDYTYQRIRFADDHSSGEYLLVFDLTNASVNEINVRVSQWSANLDPRMTQVIIVGKSMILQVVVNMLVRLGVSKIEFATTVEQAKLRAQTALKSRQLVQ